MEILLQLNSDDSEARNLSEAPLYIVVISRSIPNNDVRERKRGGGVCVK